MKPQTRLNQLVAQMLDEMFQLLPPESQRGLASTLEEIHKLSVDGRSLAWSQERRAEHAAAIREAAKARGAAEQLYLDTGDGKLMQLSSLAEAAKRLGVTVGYIRTTLSLNDGVGSFKRGSSTWRVSRNPALLEASRLSRYEETGNPDDIVEPRRSLRRPALASVQPAKK